MEKTISAAVDRLDIARLLRVVAERLPQEADRLGQRRIGDERILPDRIDQLLARDDLAWPRDEQAEHADDARRQRYFLAGAPEQLVRRIEDEGAEVRFHNKFKESSALLQRFSRLRAPGSCLLAAEAHHVALRDQVD